MNEVVAYKPSIAGRVARTVLPGLRRILPTGVYGFVYELAYGSYKKLLYVGHGVKVAARRPFVSGNRKLRDKLTFRLLPHTMGGRKALENAFDVIEKVENAKVDGAIVECGVAEGGTAAMMAMASRALGEKEREKWFFDSYEGLPEPTAEDYSDGRVGEFIRPLPKGSCLGTIEQVEELLFDDLGLDRARTHLVKGWFQDTVPPHKAIIGDIAVLRLDGDWYESTKIPLDNFYDKMPAGGYVIIDDYATCFGSRKATDEFREERKIGTPLLEDGRGGVYFEKPAAS
ncbi:Macrocin-O-methyltransferase (TylF) [Altererythrobacter xiamenensis]|uniref:Macrocin-O-methyltransferase (TylF) n=1 Tax=Altererythrobacter xiamenensis TaxID=1316679 RepID=A0A1Y6F6V8_9SPHN|nr:TylF/MycF/NovP-related O-methyltransferase [Altererythrobacter xiamenensis]SMQ69080.1 Macrocin-O-methyltransferase (TylF) [Altererythrobacter xiamenensis]